MKEFIKEIIENSFNEKIGTNEAIDDSAYYINALIETACKRQRLINSIENRLFELSKNDISTFELIEIIEIIVFLFEYKRCRTIHQIIELKRCNKEVFENINWYLKNEIFENISPPCLGGSINPIDNLPF